MKPTVSRSRGHCVTQLGDSNYREVEVVEDNDVEQVRSRVLNGGEFGCFSLERGGIATFVNSDGGQVLDTWFLNPESGLFASMSHTRARIRTLRIEVGTEIISQLRSPMVRLIEDTTGGVHDITMPPCDVERYAELGAPGHANCKDNYRAATAGIPSLNHAFVPDPLNFFQNSQYGEGTKLTFEPSLSPAGSLVRVEALTPITVVVSVCPMDIMPINGGDPKRIEVIVE